MRFLRPLLLLASLSLSAVSFPAVDAATFQIDATGDNWFQLYLSRASDPSNVIELYSQHQIEGGKEVAPPVGHVQPDWDTPSRYTNVNLEVGDVLSIYVHNEITDNNKDVLTNPSSIVARLRETNLDGTFKVGGIDLVSDQQWSCAWRHESGPDGISTRDPSRLTNYKDGYSDWARASLDITQPTSNWPLLPGQHGSTTFTNAYELARLGDPNSIWTKVGDSDVRAGLGVPIYNPITEPWPQWIYGNNQDYTPDDLAHHGWCRLTIPRTGASGIGDPVFTGFQGQVYQFHGLPDEHFNLVSSPQIQLNAHFVYLSSGKCDYNDTACYTHPGTYMDVLGFTIGETRVKLVAGTHEAGLRVWVNDIELSRGAHNFSLSEKTHASIKFDKYGKVHIRTELMDFEVSNSDMFMNVGVALLNQELLRVGSKKHTITDKVICKHNEDSYNHEVVESKVSEKYPISTPLHGLIGQTWRNLKICGHEWMGTVQDYLVSSLFGTDYHYKYFQY